MAGFPNACLRYDQSDASDVLDVCRGPTHPTATAMVFFWSELAEYINPLTLDEAKAIADSIPTFLPSCSPIKETIRRALKLAQCIQNRFPGESCSTLVLFCGTFSRRRSVTWCVCIARYIDRCIADHRGILVSVSTYEAKDRTLPSFGAMTSSARNDGHFYSTHVRDDAASGTAGPPTSKWWQVTIMFAKMEPSAGPGGSSSSGSK